MGTFSENVCIHLTFSCLGYLSHWSISCMLSVYRINSAPLTCHTKGFTDCPQAILTCLAPPRYALTIHGEQFMFSKQSRLLSAVILQSVPPLTVLNLGISTSHLLSKTYSSSESCRGLACYAAPTKPGMNLCWNKPFANLSLSLDSEGFESEDGPWLHAQCPGYCLARSRPSLTPTEPRSKRHEEENPCVVTETWKAPSLTALPRFILKFSLNSFRASALHQPVLCARPSQHPFNSNGKNPTLPSPQWERLVGTEAASLTHSYIHSFDTHFSSHQTHLRTGSAGSLVLSIPLANRCSKHIALGRHWFGILVWLLTVLSTVVSWHI